MSRLKILIIVVLLTIALEHCSASDLAIEQCPGSSVQQIRQQVQYNDISLIFYFTQWSDSLKNLDEFNDVAKIYSYKIYFSTIDCWHLSCNCSRALTTTVGSGLPHKWPTLMAYYGRMGQLQIQYHGLWSFNDLQQFIDNLLQPLERLHSSKDLQNMRFVSDAVIMGIFENADCKEYKQYLMASLKWLESDPLRTYRFTVVFAKNDTSSNDLLTDDKVPNVIFMGASSKKSYADRADHIWNASNILMWLHKELKADLRHLHGYATPITISQKLNQNNAVLAIFVNRPQKFYGYMEPYVHAERPFTAMALECKRLLKRAASRSHIDALRLQNLLANVKVYSDEASCYYNIEILYKNLEDYYEINRYLNYLYLNLSYPPTRSHYIKSRRFIRLELLNFYRLTKCLPSDLSTSNALQVGAVKRLQNIVNTDMKASNSNRSISVVILDTDNYKDYLQNLDIKPQLQNIATTCLIDKQQENIFVMNDNFEISSFKEFVQKFSKHNLLPFLRNQELNDIKTASNEYYDLKNFNRVMFANQLHYAHNQTLIVLIHSPECALCGTLQHTFIQLAAALRQLSPELQFVRINALHNDLPWHFNMDSLPALLVFPKNHYGETRLFPSHLKPNIRSVFAFILNQLSAQDQMRIVVSFCQSPALAPEHSQSCWQFAKTLLTAHIGKHLHYWQLFENERSLIFEHLRAFKDMSLDVQRNLRL